MPALIAPVICISLSLFMKPGCTCHDPGSALEVCHPVIHAGSSPAMADTSTTGWSCVIWYRWDPFVDCSIDRRLFLRTTPIFLILLVGQDQNKTKQKQFRQLRGIQRLPLLASQASFWPHAADSYLCAPPVAVDDKEK